MESSVGSAVTKLDLSDGLSGGRVGEEEEKRLGGWLDGESEKIVGERDASGVNAANIVDFAERERAGACSEEEKAMLVLVGKRSAGRDGREVERSHAERSGSEKERRTTNWRCVDRGSRTPDRPTKRNRGRWNGSTCLEARRCGTTLHKAMETRLASAETSW